MKAYYYFWALIRYRPHYFVGDVLAIGTHFLLFSAFGLILQRFFNGLTGAEGATLTMWGAAGAQLLYALVTVTALGIAAIVFINFKMHTTALMIRNMMDYLLGLPGGEPLPKGPSGEVMGTGEVISTLRDDTEHLLDTMVLIDDVTGWLLTMVVLVGVMVQVNVWVMVGTFAPLALIIMMARWLGEWAKKYRVVSRQTTGDVTAMIADMFQATDTIKAAHAEERIVAQFRLLNGARREAMVRDRTLTKLVDVLGGGATDVGMGIVLLLTAGAMYRGEFSVGDFALFGAYLWPMTRGMQVMGNLWARYKQAEVATVRMEALMVGAEKGAVVAAQPLYLKEEAPEPPVVVKTATDRLARLEVEGLGYRYEDGKGIEGVSLAIERGMFVVVTGEIGSGKSTFLATLVGLLPAQAGEVRWNGEVVTDGQSFFVPPRCGYTGQLPGLFSATVRENILLGWGSDDEGVARAVKRAVMEPDLGVMEAGLETMVGPRGMRLSGGQIQRTAAARMFVRETELLVVDDLSSALDVHTERALWGGVWSRADEGRPTCLVVSHRQPVWRMADWVVVMAEGRVVDQGRLDELLVRCEVLQGLAAMKRGE